MPAGSFVQLSKRRGGERADDGGDWDSRVARVRAINGRGQQSTVESRKKKETVIPGVTALGRAVDVCGGDIEEGELAAGGHYVAAAGVADEGWVAARHAACWEGLDVAAGGLAVRERAGVQGVQR